MPVVSVVMSVYNTKTEYLQESINSILNQSFSDFEFIIIDDGSDDETQSFLQSINDRRVIVMRNPSNIGITKSLNIGFRLAMGKYIARMDSDDIAVKDRLKKQVEYMEANPDVIVCGSSIRFFSDSADMNGERKIYYNPIDNMELFRIKLLFSNCGPAHPSAFFNKDLLNKYSLAYDEYYKNSQDYAMWVECSNVGKMYILSDTLLYYRVHNDQISSKAYKTQQFYAISVRAKQLKLLFPSINNEMVIRHEQALNNELSTKEAIKWFKQLKKANKKNRVYDKALFSKYLDFLIKKQKQ